MLRLWEFLWHGCWHNWEQEGQGNITFEGSVCGTYYNYKCTKCHRHKSINVL